MKIKISFDHRDSNMIFHKSFARKNGFSLSLSFSHLSSSYFSRLRGNNFILIKAKEYSIEHERVVLAEMHSLLSGSSDTFLKCLRCQRLLLQKIPRTRVVRSPERIFANSGIFFRTSIKTLIILRFRKIKRLIHRSAKSVQKRNCEGGEGSGREIEGPRDVAIITVTRSLIYRRRGVTILPNVKLFVLKYEANCESTLHLPEFS
ncbi:hypothetical protein PUN28_010691 [Cardiocondyla obscurior]|uniref:Uncharacterized protein n=1 Tax=Cardiocondyla obscurior TaxID=286306 RepID=A0AAW2FKM4_9HYME